MDFVNCAAEFALSELGKDDEIVMKSFMLLKNCAEVLSTDNVPTRKPSTHFDQKDLRMSIIHTDTTRAEAMEKVKHATDNGHLNPEPNSPADNEEDFFLKWFPIFSAFSRVVVESRSMIVRTAAIDTLFEVYSDIHGVLSSESNAVLRFYESLDECFLQNFGTISSEP